MSTNLGDRLATQAAAEKQGIRQKDLDVLGWLNAETTRSEIVKALPRGLDAARFVRQVQTEVRKNPALLSADPRSFILAVLYFAQLGLDLGPLGHAYITGPFEMKDGRKEVVPIIGYKGLCELAYRSDTIDLVDATTVREGERFIVQGGTDPKIVHEVDLSKRESQAVAYYAIAAPKGGGRVVFDVMTPGEVERIKARSKAAKSQFSPWTTDYETMAQKTVIRRLLNRGRVRLSPQVQEAIAQDELTELGLDKAALLDPAMLPHEPAAAEVAQQATTTATAGAEAAGTTGESSDKTAPKSSTSTDPGAAFRPKGKESK